MKTAHAAGAVFRGKFVALGCLFSGWLPGRNDGVLRRHLYPSLWQSDCWNNAPQKNRNRISPWEKEKAKRCAAQSRGTCLSWLYPRALQEELKPRQSYPSWAGPHLGMSSFIIRTLALYLNINLVQTLKMCLERPWLSLFLFPVCPYWINHAFLSFMMTLSHLFGSFVTYFSFSRQGQCTLDWPESVM